MKQLCKLILIFSVLFGGSAFALEETFLPTDTVDQFSQWEFKDTWTIGAITDNDDATYAFTFALSDTDIYVIANPTEDYTNYTIDSVKYFKRLKVGTAAIGNLRVSAIVGSDTIKVDIALDDIGTSFAVYGFNFPRTGLTDSSWSETDVDNMKISSELTGLVGLDTVFTARDSAKVYATLNVSSSGEVERSGFATFYGKCNNTEQNIASSTVDFLDTTNVKIPSANLVSGHEYLVFYHGSIGATSIAAVPQYMCVYGNDTLAHIAYESGGSGSASIRSSWGGGIQGFKFISGDGTNSIYSKWSNSINDDAWFTGHCLAALDLNNQTQNTHYFIAQTDFSDDTVIVDNVAGDNTDTTLIAGTFTLAAGEHLVLMCGEYKPVGATSNDGVALYGYIDGAVRKKTGKLTFEDADDWASFMSVEVITFSAGSHTFQIRGGGRDGNASAAPFRRGAIAVLDLQYWPTYAYSQIATDSAINTLYSSWKTHLEATITPSSSQDVLVLGNMYGRNTSGGGTSTDAPILARLLNSTDAISQSELSSYNPRDDEDTVAISSMGFLAAWGTSGKTFRFQNCKAANVNTMLASDGTLFILGMEEDLSAPAAATSGRRRKEAQESYIEPQNPIKFVMQELHLPDCHCEE